MQKSVSTMQRMLSEILKLLQRYCREVRETVVSMLFLALFQNLKPEIMCILLLKHAYLFRSIGLFTKLLLSISSFTYTNNWVTKHKPDTFVNYWPYQCELLHPPYFRNLQWLQDLLLIYVRHLKHAHTFSLSVPRCTITWLQNSSLR